MITDVDAVDHERAERNPAQVEAHHRFPLFSRRGHEPPTDRALARAACLNPGRRGFDRSRLVARRHAEHHLLDCPRRQRICGREVRPGLERNLMTVDVANARTTDGSAATSDGELAMYPSDATSPPGVADRHDFA